jgi:glycogen debranching enzyme
MTAYVQSMARLFEGFRLDNCHSTPIMVGEYLMDKAREVRGDLWICAELFTGSKEVDEVFVKKLGINSLIREALSRSSIVSFITLPSVSSYKFERDY